VDAPAFEGKLGSNLNGQKHERANAKRAEDNFIEQVEGAGNSVLDWTAKVKERRA
jgi:hypothetical protein